MKFLPTLRIAIHVKSNIAPALFSQGVLARDLLVGFVVYL